MLANFHLSSITGLGLLLFCGYFCGQLARYLKLPALIGYLAKHLLFHHSGKAVDNLHLISMATSETATDFIDRPVITAHLSETIEPVLERMLSANIKEIPVLDDQGRLIGDLTLVDILHLCAKDFLNNESC